MRLTVLGSCGAWPEAGRACSGFLVEHDDFRLVLDIGYATLPRLLAHAPPDRIDAVLVTHGHPDHCADLNPLLRARALREPPCPPLPVYAPPGALDAVLALDRPGMLDDAIDPRDLNGAVEVGPFAVATRPLPHWTPNLGVRLIAGGLALAYTGDCGPSPDVVGLARDADVLLAEASYPDRVPDDSVGLLSSAADAGREATEAGAGRLVLTHLMPGTDPERAREAAGIPCEVAHEGLVIDL